MGLLFQLEERDALTQQLRGELSEMNSTLSNEQRRTKKIVAYLLHVLHCRAAESREQPRGD